MRFKGNRTLRLYRAVSSVGVVSSKYLKLLDNGAVPPTLLIRIVRGISFTAATKDAMSEGVNALASHVTVRKERVGWDVDSSEETRVSLVVLRPWSTMLKPWEAMAWARAKPMPSVEPVMRAQEGSLLV